MFQDDSQTNTDTQLEIQALLEVDVDDNLEHATLEETEDGIEEDLVVLPTLPTPQRRAVGGTLFARPQGSAAEAREGIGGDLVVPQTPLRQPVKRTPFARSQGNGKSQN